jgi:hypothetical protein
LKKTGRCVKIFDVGIKSALLCLLLFLLNGNEEVLLYFFIGIVLDILATLEGTGYPPGQPGNRP